MLTDDKSMRKLNRDYRGKDKPTNVLSFAALDGAKPKAGVPWLLGDIVLASGVIAREAKQQAKKRASSSERTWRCMACCTSWATTTKQDADAESMEALEIAALAGMGIANPYETRPMTERDHADDKQKKRPAQAVPVPGSAATEAALREAIEEFIEETRDHRRRRSRRPANPRCCSTS